QQTRDLGLPDPLRLMTERSRNRRAHACRPNRVGTIIAANEPPASQRMRNVVETHQLRNESTGDKERGMLRSGIMHRQFFNSFAARRISFEEIWCQGKNGENARSNHRSLLCSDDKVSITIQLPQHMSA